MKEALHQICLEGASEIEMPDDVVPALAEVPAQTSP